MLTLVTAGLEWRGWMTHRCLISILVLPFPILVSLSINLTGRVS